MRTSVLLGVSGNLNWATGRVEFEKPKLPVTAHGATYGMLCARWYCFGMLRQSEWETGQVDS